MLLDILGNPWTGYISNDWDYQTLAYIINADYVNVLDINPIADPNPSVAGDPVTISSSYYYDSYEWNWDNDTAAQSMDLTIGMDYCVLNF